MGIAASKLKGGVDYPRDRLEFDEFFPDEESCLVYLEHACQIPHTPTGSLYRGTGRGPPRRCRS